MVMFFDLIFEINRKSHSVSFKPLVLGVFIATFDERYNDATLQNVTLFDEQYKKN